MVTFSLSSGYFWLKSLYTQAYKCLLSFILDLLVCGWYTHASARHLSVYEVSICILTSFACSFVRWIMPSESYMLLLFSLELDCSLSDRRKGRPFSPVTVTVMLIICDSSIPQFPRILSTFCPVYYAAWTTRTSDACLWPYSHIMDSEPCSCVWKQPNTYDGWNKEISDHRFVCPNRPLFWISMARRNGSVQE